MTVNESTRCRWDREAGEYRDAEGETCETPRKHHCPGHKCGMHLGWGELTCARCLHRARFNIRRIGALSTLLMTAALESRRIDSEAANLAGPAADAEAWSWRKIAAKQGVAWHLSQIEDDDEYHPYTVLTRWAMMLSQDYGHPQPAKWTIARAGAYLERQLSTMAHDEAQDFPLLARELKKCRERVDGALCVRAFKQEGVPCPTCHEAGKFARLVRKYPHWCEDTECKKIHVATDEADTWVCPRDAGHWWSHKDYTNRLEDRRAG